MIKQPYIEENTFMCYNIHTYTSTENEMQRWVRTALDGRQLMILLYSNIRKLKMIMFRRLKRNGLHRLVAIRLFRNGMRLFCSANPAV